VSAGPASSSSTGASAAGTPAAGASSAGACSTAVAGGERAPTRAGIVVTGTEVLTGRVADRNGPWLAERLRELGVELAHTAIVGDRPQDMRAALQFMRDRGIELVVTSGGLGPTADDLTAAVVGELQGREMVLDRALAERIAAIVRPLMRRWPNIDPEALAAANRKQATVPRGATVLEPVGTAPGLVVPPAQEGPTIVVLPGPPRELQPMWAQALATQALQAALAHATVYTQRTLRLFGIPESEIAETLRLAEREGVALERLEVTTCLKRGEVEIVTRYEPDAQQVYDAFAATVERRHADALFSRDGSTVDEQVAALLRGSRPPGRPRARALRARTIATAESCTGGLLAARLTELAGASEYFNGAVVAYSNEAKVACAGVPRELIEAHGAVSAEVARALADGARAALGADVGVGVTGVAGPGGGSEEKPVGLVWLSVTLDGGEGADAVELTRSVNLPGGRADVRDRATTVAMHLLRRALTDAAAP
jgi:competence/damage-inducible protein CinA-like protein